MKINFYKVGRPELCWALLCGCAIAILFLVQYRPEGEVESRPQRSEAIHLPSEVEVLRTLEKVAGESVFFRSLAQLFSLCIFLGILIDIQSLWRFLRRRFASAPFSLDIEWGVGKVAKAVIVFILAFTVVRYFGAEVQNFYGTVSEISFSLTVQFLAEGVTLLYIFWVIPVPWARVMERLGITRRNLLRHLGAGVKGYVGFLPILLCLTWLTECASGWMGIPLEPQEEMKFFFADLSLPALVFLVCFVACAGPIFEEIFFRGFAYQALRRKFRRWPSIVITALLFSALHANIAVFLPIMGLGVLLAYMVEATGSLLPSIVIHICQNSIAVAGALLLRSVSGG
ncbi:MAG: CPBP family intramembrane metalloprotease [Candidatus Aureabacteria bacterium]|nr:CPBP family intramembrane metalloprotease [Candidatus Auribacterota bacterium]